MRRAVPQDNAPEPPDAQRRLAARILRIHLGERPRRLQPLGGGLTNQVFRLETRGRSYVVRASGGHVRDLPKTKIGVDTDHGFEPQYLVSRDKSKTVAPYARPT